MIKSFRKTENTTYVFSYEKYLEWKIRAIRIATEPTLKSITFKNNILKKDFKDDFVVDVISENVGIIKNEKGKAIQVRPQWCEEWACSKDVSNAIIHLSKAPFML